MILNMYNYSIGTPVKGLEDMQVYTYDIRSDGIFTADFPTSSINDNITTGDDFDTHSEIIPTWNTKHDK